ncbi:MAG: nucleoside hydrolase [Chloroflexota bacterium]|nr:nucleoside hydrolase [Chloroflexota bacterium]
MRNFIIDTDTASDDAVALVMALRQPDIDVKAITVVAGNVPLEMGIQNALYTVELCGADTPVYAGCAKPLLRELETAQDVHGRDGLGDIGLPLQGRAPARGHAADVLRDVINANAGDITLVTLGPLTNVALALLREPELAQRVSHCWIMGGIGAGHGNVTPTAEFNIWVDPEAAKIVYESGMKMTMVGWDISWKYATFDAEQAAEIRGVGTRLAEFVVDIQATLTEFSMTENALPGFDLPDPITMAAAIDPGIAEFKNYRVDVTTGEGLARGITVVDVRGVGKRAPQMRVATSAARSAFVDMLKRSVS